jgi:hypothetical protein
VESVKAVEDFCEVESRHSQVQMLLFSPELMDFKAEGAVASQIRLNQACPPLQDGNGQEVLFDTDDALDYWTELAKRLLELWV